MCELTIIDQDITINDITFRNENGKWRVYVERKEQKEVYESIYNVNKSNRFFILKLAEQNYYQIIDCNNRWNSLSSIYKSITFFREDRILVENEESKWGFMSMQSYWGAEYVMPCIFDFIQEREDGLFDIQKLGAWGVIDLDGRILVPISFKRTIRKDFLSYSGFSIEEASDYSGNFEFYSMHGLNGLYRFEKGHVENVIPPFYTNIYTPKRDYGYYKQKICDFIFCSIGVDVINPSYDEEGLYACRDGFIDCYTLRGKKLSAKYKCYYLTREGDFVFAGRDGKLDWIDTDEGKSDLKSFFGYYDMINGEGNICIEGIGDFYDCGDNIILLNFESLKDFWVIMADKNKLIKVGHASYILDFPISFTERQFRKKVSQYRIDLYNDLEQTLIEYGFTPQKAKDTNRYVMNFIRENEENNYTPIYYEKYEDKYN